MNQLKDMDLKGKRVLMRVDFNVPVEEGVVTDTTRIEAERETIDYILSQGASLILMSHRGRPKGEYREDFSLEPVRKKAEEVLGLEIVPLFTEEVINGEILNRAKELKPGEVALLENLRFREEEEKNDEAFAKELSKLGDIFVNDAFGTAHRAHASNVGVSKFLPSNFGLLMGEEVEILTGLIQKPEYPFVGIIGGAKVSDKISVMENLLDHMDKMIVVGAMANTFLLAGGHAMGKSLVEEEYQKTTQMILKKGLEKGVDILLPVDAVVASSLEDEAGEVVAIDEIEQDKMVLDIGPETIEQIREALAGAKSVFWNGPAGVFEKAAFSKGTFAIAEILADLNAKVIIGGGDSAHAIKSSGFEEEITHISSGGGASLELLEGKELPGIAAIKGE